MPLKLIPIGNITKTVALLNQRTDGRSKITALFEGPSRPATMTLFFDGPGKMPNPETSHISFQDTGSQVSVKDLDRAQVDPIDGMCLRDSPQGLLTFVKENADLWTESSFVWGDPLMEDIGADGKSLTIFSST